MWALGRLGRDSASGTQFHSCQRFDGICTVKDGDRHENRLAHDERRFDDGNKRIGARDHAHD